MKLLRLCLSSSSFHAMAVALGLALTIAFFQPEQAMTPGEVMILYFVAFIAHRLECGPGGRHRRPCSNQYPPAHHRPQPPSNPPRRR